MKFVEYLQQPCSVYALMALLLNTKAGGALLPRMEDVSEWFQNQGITVDTRELKQRWKELEDMGFAERNVLTEKGDKAAEALFDVLTYIKQLSE